MNDLNPEQSVAVKVLSTGNVAVLAGPGSGKTHTLVAAIRSLLTKNRPRILCVTFTNKAADHLKQQLDTHNNLFVGTFHALAAQLCREAGHEVQLVAEEDAIDTVSTLRHKLTLKDMTIRECMLVISRYKNGGAVTAEAKQLTEEYDAVLAASHLSDYDDLIAKGLEYVVATNYDYIFVDEFQDTSPKQYELLQKLAGKTTKLFVIGDPKQSIYRFRGADGSIFQRFQADFQPKLIDLRHNYRSTSRIVETANHIFSNLVSQTAVRSDTGLVRIIETLDEYSQADYIVRTIEHGLGGIEWHTTHHEKQWLSANTFADFAVLYRTRRQGKRIADKLRKSGIPVQCLGEESPYVSPIVQLALRIVAYKLEPSETHLTEVKKAAQRAKIKGIDAVLPTVLVDESPHTVVHKLAEQLGKQTDDNLIQLEELAIRFTHVSDLLKHLSLLSEQAFFDPHADAVHLSTIHASKGLEFRHVFVVGCIEGILPSSRAIETEDLAEEQRLFYVAATRARDSLILLYTKLQDKQPSRPSQFLKLVPFSSEIDDQLTAVIKQRQRARQRHSQQQLF